VEPTPPQLAPLRFAPAPDPASRDRANKRSPAALFDEAEAIHVRLGAAFMAERTRVERARMRV
jgi:hypothetical protein